MELRFLTGAALRTAPGNRIQGYAAVFEQWSDDLGGFREKIKKGAFSRTLRGADVTALFNHDPNFILGRTSSGTLQLKEDHTGLWFSCQLPDSPSGRDVHAAVARGDVRGCSFGFIPQRDSWSRDRTERTLLDVDLLDVGPVVRPAYPQTSVEARALARRQVTRAGIYDFRGAESGRSPRVVDRELEGIRLAQKFRLRMLQDQFEREEQQR